VDIYSHVKLVRNIIPLTAMVHENEVLMLILGTGVLIFIILNITQIRRIGYYSLLLVSFCFLLFAWFATVIEGFLAEKYFNFSEHISYLISSIIFVIWSFKAFRKSREEAAK